jgi:ribosomal protein S18 acetylase RimI-like enzyme
MTKVTLVPMTQEFFDSFIENEITSYAAEHVKSGRWTEEESVEKSREEFKQLLPNGVQSEKQHLFTIHNEANERVGIIWLGIQPNGTGWIYNIVIDEEFRRHGHAEGAFQEIETYAKSLGLPKIGLHVFGHNQGAYKLYQKLGYETLNIIMGKSLE